MEQPQYLHTMYILVFVGYGLASLAYLSLIVNQSLGAARVGKGILILALLLQAVYLVQRVNADHAYTGLWYAPVANIFEEATTLTWGMTLMYLVTEIVTGFRALGTFMVPMTSLLVGWCAFGGGAMDQSIEQPPPALQSYWMDIHVPTHVVAYGAFALAFCMAIAYFLKRKEERMFGGISTGGSAVQSDEETPQARSSVAVKEKVSPRRDAGSTGFLSWIPSTDELDKMMYKMAIIGFGFETALIMLGAVWAEVSWGTYWGWDPKETASAITWIVYAIYIHGRFLLGWGTKRRDLCAGLCIAGFAAVLFTYLGVGFLLPGLHSYLKNG